MQFIYLIRRHGNYEYIVAIDQQINKLAQINTTAVKLEQTKQPTKKIMNRKVIFFHQQTYLQ